MHHIHCLRAALRLLCIGGLLLTTSPTAAQERDDPADTEVIRTGRPAIFLDCRRCDDNYIRREITFVDFVREREQAGVHVLVTDQSTGSGGREYTFNLIGQGPFEDQDHILSYTASSTSTEEEVRNGIVRTLKLALVPYLMQTSVAERISVTVEEAVEADIETEDDPWNGWTIAFYGDGYGEMEASQYELRLRYGVFIDRVTELWKIRLRPYFNYSVDQFERDSETIRSESRRDGFDSYAIRSINEHWSIGVFGDVYTSTFSNIELRLRGGPGVEYSVFPYREASRRRLTVAYFAAGSDVQYRDTTIFGKTAERLPLHRLVSDYEITQTWGSVDFGLEASQYLHDPSKYRVELDGGASVRLMRGFSVHVGAELELIHDQLNLPKADATLEELLLRRRQLATSYELSGSLGFRYRFGSIYNNVVNTRF